MKLSEAKNKFSQLVRRTSRYWSRATVRKAWHLFGCLRAYAFKQKRIGAYPTAVKIDISPLCNLRCTVCVHADANGNPELEAQQFDSKQRMSVAQYTRIIDEIAGKSTLVSLYYLGDPMMHPNLDEMCKIAFDRGLNVHVSTNFSFNLSDERIKSICESGVTHFTAAVDGLSQEKYELTRVGGKIDRVLHNIDRLVKVRNESGRSHPHIEIQYIKFQHNIDEIEQARERFEQLGVDQFTHFWGSLDNYTDGNSWMQTAMRESKSKKLTPLCFWPYHYMTIKYNGDVIPCCRFRTGEQYTDTDPRSLGNVFDTSVIDVWNSKSYQTSRRLVSNPQAALEDASLQDNFCYQCPELYDVQTSRPRHKGDQFHFHQLYTINESNVPARR